MRQHAWFRRRNSTDPSAVAPSRFDVILNRVGAISAIVLVIITGLTFVYTVIPIWKANLLEEQLSRKQIELNRMQEQLEMTYARVRSASIREYLSPLGAKCTGLLEVEDVTYPRHDKTPAWLKLLPADAKDCLTAPALNSPALAQIRTPDRVLFMKRLSEAAALIEEDRARTREEIEHFTEKALEDPTILPELEEGSFTKAFADLLNSPQDELLESRLHDAQMKLALKWGDRSQERIIAIARMEFPTAE